MFRNTEELLQDPIGNSVLYYQNGWLGAKTIRKSFGYWMMYKMAPSVIKEVFRKEEIRELPYQAASERLYLSGRLGISVWARCVKEWIRFKTEKKAPKTPAAAKTVQCPEQERVLGQIREKYEAFGKDRNRVWIFDAGSRFLGNPKWLFLYVSKYRQDILACWMSDSAETVNRILGLGFYALCYGTREAETVKDMAGVFVVENVKEHIPSGLENVKMLNLFHGVGCKRIERNQPNEYFSDKLAGKYTRYNSFYLNRQLLLVTSPFIEKDFKFQIGVDEDKLIRAGYPRCIYQQYLEPVHTFERNLSQEKGLPESTKLIVYAPTYRYTGVQYFFNKAIPSMERLNDVLQKKSLLLIMKFHPFMEEDPQYIAAKEMEGDYSNIIFWNNEDDFYEIMDQMDLAIVDYSSIFTDFVAAGINHFIRYVFDYEEEKDNLDLMYDYYKVTAGKICSDFEMLLESIAHYDMEMDLGELGRIRQLYWEYSDRNSFDRIIQKTLDYKVVKKELPVLYSYDVFDTVFTRKVLSPEGIFFYVRGKMESVPDLAYPNILVKRYPEIRSSCEANVRFRKNRTMKNDWDRREIYFDEIFENMKQVYGLDDEQCSRLKEWELEAELDNVLPLEERVAEIKEHLMKGDDVVFISDMYLPKEHIRKMLLKADAAFGEIPLYVSSEYGVQKTTGKLFLTVYNSIGFYKYGEWIHCGDNVYADQTQPGKLGIRTRLVRRCEFNEYEEKLVKALNSYDGYLIAGNLARFRHEHIKEKEIFARNYAAFYFIPYVSWVLRDAVKRGYQRLYFISRDGYHLKRIADELIRKEDYPIQTSYLYASRKTWRIPSFIDAIDDDFFSSFGDFAEISSMEGFLKAAQLNETQFKAMFPEQEKYLEQDCLSSLEKDNLVEVLHTSEAYHKYLLGVARDKRKLVDEYLLQEMNFEETFAIVEYWGRGYTQDCFVRLVEDLLRRKREVPFYYVRSINITSGTSIRYNYSANTTSLLFVEALFSNIFYKSIGNYRTGQDGRVIPVIEDRVYDKELFEAMECYLPEMCSVITEAGNSDREQTERTLFDFALNYYAGHHRDAVLADCLAPLMDAVAVNGEMIQYAPKIGVRDMENIRRGANSVFRSRDSFLSYMQSTNEIQKVMEELYQGKKNLFDSRMKLNLSQIDTERKIEERQRKYENAALKMQELYEKNVAKQKVSPYRFLIVTSNYDGEEFYSIKRELEKERLIDVFVLPISNATCSDIEMREIASARYILTSSHIDLLSMLQIRRETEVIQIMNIAFPYIKIGLSRWYKIRKERDYAALKLRNQYSYLPVASEHMIPTIVDAYGLKNNASCLTMGSCVSDVYFSSEYKKSAEAKLKKLLHGMAGRKKIIAYLPLHRYRNAACKYLQLLNIRRLLELLGNEYIVLFMPEERSRKDIPEEYFNIAGVYDFVHEMTIREQMVVADIIVGDYRHTFFEASLLNKPVFCTAADYREVEKGSQVYCPYAEVQAGPIVHDADELAAMIQELHSYDERMQKRFREHYLGSCKGDAGRQLVQYIKEKMESEITLCKRNSHGTVEKDIL